MNNTKTALSFWRRVKEYPNYPYVLQRRFIDICFILSKISNYNPKSILDLGCGDGSALIALREFTNAELFYGYDISERLVYKLLDRWGQFCPGLFTGVTDVTKIDKFPQVDVTLSLGVFPYIFYEEVIQELLDKIKSDVFIVRAPCTLKEKVEVINKFSEELEDDYAAVYRTVCEYVSILSEFFVVSEISRAYPDEIESKYGTKQYFFVCTKPV